MASFASSYHQTSGGSATRARDQGSFSYTPRPQVMSVYVKFIERGTVNGLINTKVLYIGNAGGTGGFFAIQAAGSNNYRIKHVTSTSLVTSTFASGNPSRGDTVEIVGQLNSNGSVKGLMSVNSGAEVTTSTSSALTLEQTWGGQLLWLNSTSTSNVGYNLFLAVALFRGIRTMDQMRRLAGTD